MSIPENACYGEERSHNSLRTAGRTEQQIEMPLIAMRVRVQVPR